MTAALTSQVSQLLYRAMPGLNFAKVVGDLSHRFSIETGKDAILAWDCDDIAVLDLQSARIVIGFTENLPGLHAACVTIAIGQSPLEEANVLSTTDQSALHLAVAERIQRRFPHDAHRSFSIDHALTPDLIDHVVDDLFQGSVEVSHDRFPTQVEMKAADAMPSQGAEVGDMDRLIHRLSSELTARAPSLITRAIASATPKDHKPEGEGSISSRPMSSLFWRNGQPASAIIDSEIVKSHDNRHRPTPSGELKAVRDALCAGDTSVRVANDGVAAQTKHALRALIALPQNIAMSMADKRRRDAPTKH